MSQFNEETQQKEMQTFLEGLRASSQLQQNIADFTSRCWDKCITGAPGTSLSGSEQRCLVNCVDRFVDASVFMVKKLDQERTSRAGSQ